MRYVMNVHRARKAMLMAPESKFRGFTVLGYGLLCLFWTAAPHVTYYNVSCEGTAGRPFQHLYY